MALTDAEKQIIDFAARWYRFPGAQEQAIRDELDLSATAYFARLNHLLDRPEALAYAPTTVNRLRRVRDTRARARSAKARGIQLGA